MSDDDIFLICWEKFLNANAVITMAAITIIAAIIIMQPMLTTRCSAGDCWANKYATEKVSSAFESNLY